VWEYLTSPAKRILYQFGATRIDQANPDGRRGPGTTTHCVHGDSATVYEEILDWRPFDYFTERFSSTGLSAAEMTVQLSATDTGTLATYRMRLPRAKEAREAWEAAGGALTQAFQQSAARMIELLAAEVADEGPPATAPPEPHTHPH
jgi:hypothetical protein